MNVQVRARFDDCLDLDQIRTRVTVRPQPLIELSGIDHLIAAEIMEESLRNIYVPNKFSLDFIREMLGRASLHNADLFKSETEYVSRIYNPPELEKFPVCLTGLAGVGKSQTIAALRKVCPPAMDFNCSHFQGSIELISHWYVSARGKSSGKQLLLDVVLGDLEAGKKTNVAKLLIESRRRANLYGVSLAMLDETQHITGSGASKVTDILLTMAAIGLPIIFVSNYSLVHKLIRRNSEDKQRLLSEPRIMLPDHPDSQDWKDYVSECIRVCNGHIQVGMNELTTELYRSTFGIKRLAVQLLKLAYIECRSAGRKSINLADVSKAFRSSAYSSNSRDVQQLQLQSLQPRNPGTHLDLRCPFDLPIDRNANVVSFAREDRDNRVNAAVFDSALNEKERLAMKHIGLLPGDVARSSKQNRPAPVPKVSDEEMTKSFFEIVSSLKQTTKPRKPR